uniref:Synaptopodin n=1 Tax=Labrus bergylta TaxID=56723 RepID=A0A3Q3H0T4_9LABR
KQTSTIINRTARPFFSPPTVQSPGTVNPIMDIPPPPSYATPPLPSQPLLSPHFLHLHHIPHLLYPALQTNRCRLSCPLHLLHLPSSLLYPIIRPCPITALQQKQMIPIKTGILEEGASRRANRKSMFTFKEKPIVAPNPELLSLVQGTDERKKHGLRSVPEPASEEELLALGAEASNFLAKEEDRAEETRAPEWASCLKSSRTRPRLEHRPEHTLTNVSGKGAELFAKRQSRMEKYVVENQISGQIRSPSPTMSLPPSWVYQSNMPGRVKAITESPAPEPVPEPPPLENGCSKIEMDLSRHRPYQLNSSLFIFNPTKDPLSTLPRGAQTSLPHNPPSHFRTQCLSPQLPLSPTGGLEYPSKTASGQPRISSPMSAFSPERMSSPRSGVQAPRPTFSAKKAGIAAQVWKPSPCQSPMVGNTTTSRPPQTSFATSPVSPPWGSRSQSPALSQTSLSFSATKPQYTSSVSTSKDSRCMSPIVNNLDSKANHRLLAKNIINAAKRKNSPSPGALSGQSLPISPLGNSHHGYDCHKPPISPFQSRSLGAQSPAFTSPPATPTQRICSPVRLYNTRSLTDSDASVESEDSGLRSPGFHSYNTCPRGWGGSLRMKRNTVSTDL